MRKNSTIHHIKSAIEDNIRVDIECKDKKEMTENILCCLSGVSRTKVKTGKVSAEEWKELCLWNQKLAKAPIYLHEKKD